MVAAQSNQRMILPQGAHQVGTPVPLEKPDIHFGRRGGKEFLGEGQHVAFSTVMCHQQPPGKALLQVVATIAGRRL